MPPTRKRPCRICRRWFYPDPRVGERHRACGNPTCQAARRRKTQAHWRAANPGYAAASRIDQRHSNTVQEPELLRVPAPLNQLPWNVAKDQFGGKGADFMAVMCTLLLNTAKDQSSRYPIDPTIDPRNNPIPPKETRSQPAHTETRAQPNAASTGISSTRPPTGAPPGPPTGAIPASVGVAG